MKTTTKKISDTRVEVTVTLDQTELMSARKKAVDRLAQNLKVQGFRNGKAPASYVEKQLSPNAIAETTIDIAVRTTMPAAFESAKQEPVAILGANVTKYVPDESAEYVVTAEILPDVKIGDFKKLKAKREVVEPTDQDIEDVLNQIANAYVEKSVTKNPAQNGDEVIIDFVGKRENGEAFEGGTAKDYHLELGSGAFIPGFEEAIVGHSAGDKFDINVTFPKEYPEKSLAGKPAIFEILLKQVNEQKRPALDDELAKRSSDFQTIDELKNDIKTNLSKQNLHRANEVYRDALVSELVKNSKVAAPEILIDDQLHFIRNDMVRNAASHGLTFEQYLDLAGQTAEEWEKQARELAEARAKTALVLQLLAKEQKITASDEEVNAKIAELKDLYKRSKEALKNLKDPKVFQDVKNRLVIDKTVDFLVSSNKGPEDAIMNQPAEKK